MTKDEIQKVTLGTNEALRVTADGEFIWHPEADAMIEYGDFTSSPAMRHILRALRKALVGSVQEPVATLWQHGETGRTRITMPGDITDCDARWFKASDLYTTPPAAPDLQAELEATNRQVEILSDALAESRREVAALKAVQEPVAFFDPQGKGFYWAKPAKIIAPVTVDVKPLPLYTTPPAAPVQEPMAWVDLLEQAEEVVRSKSLWKKYINGTPLANDIAVWMVTFAQEHATPPAAQRQWVGLTDEEITDIWAETTPYYHEDDFARAIEAKLKKLNT
jgi:hypothetical protein